MKQYQGGLIIKLILSLFLVFKICSCDQDLLLIKKSGINGFYYKSGHEKKSNTVFNLVSNSHQKEFVGESKKYGYLRLPVPHHMDEDLNEIIIISAPFPQPLAALNILFKDVTTYLALVPVQTEGDNNQKVQQNYVGHIVYIRNAKGGKSVEWDFIDDPIKKGSFASALIHHQNRLPGGRSMTTLIHVKQMISRRRKGRKMSWRKKRSISSKMKHKHHNEHEVQELEIFNGIGGCKSDKLDGADRNSWNSTMRIIFYLNVLRIGCIPGFFEEFQRLLQKGCVTEGADLRYQLTLQHPLFSASILDDAQEWTDLISAIFLYAFSNAYSNEIETVELTASDNEFSTDQVISFTAKIITEFIFKILDLMGTQVFYHTIKIANALVNCLKLRIQFADHKLKKHNKEDASRTTIKQDQLQMASLIDFLHENLLEILEIGENQMPDAFAEYVEDNRKSIQTNLLLFKNYNEIK